VYSTSVTVHLFVVSSFAGGLAQHVIAASGSLKPSSPAFLPDVVLAVSAAAFLSTISLSTAFLQAAASVYVASSVHWLTTESTVLADCATLILARGGATAPSFHVCTT
jgi:hypothetical protein